MESAAFAEGSSEHVLPYRRGVGCSSLALTTDSFCETNRRPLGKSLGVTLGPVEKGYRFAAANVNDNRALEDYQ